MRTGIRVGVRVLGDQADGGRVYVQFTHCCVRWNQLSARKQDCAEDLQACYAEIYGVV